MAKEHEDVSPISTGHLPRAPYVQSMVESAHQRFASEDSGANADYHPALAEAPRDLLGISVASVDGTVHTAGDAEYPFTIMSVAKPFIFALVCQAIGASRARALLGVNSTGLPFNSVMAVELNPHRLTNLMLNPGAIATTSLMPGATAKEKWRAVDEGLSRFAGRALDVNEEVYASASASNDRNQALARLMHSYGRLYFQPVATTVIYTRQSSLNVTARDLAVMGATLADGGVNPITRERVIDD